MIDIFKRGDRVVASRLEPMTMKRHTVRGVVIETRGVIGGACDVLFYAGESSPYGGKPVFYTSIS